jgi:hypothetical protein
MKPILVLLVILAFSFSAFAGDVGIAWDYGTPMPSGFELRVSSVSGGPAIRTFDCGPSAAKTCTLTAQAPGSYFMKIYAYNISTPASLGSEYSGASNEVAFTIASTPTTPTNQRITGKGLAKITFEVPQDKLATIKLSFGPAPQ